MAWLKQEEKKTEENMDKKDGFVVHFFKKNRWKRYDGEYLNYKFSALNYKI